MFELLSRAYNTLLFIPILNALIVFYFWLGHNMGFAIIALTLVIKLLMFPLSQKQMLSQVKYLQQYYSITAVAKESAGASLT